MSTIVLVDDQALVRDGLRLILELAGHDVVGEAADGESGIRTVLALGPDVVLMDVRMPVMDGIEATRRIVSAGSPSRVIMLTTFDIDEHVFDALRAGASGYLLKDSGGQRIVDAVERAAQGEMPVAGPVMARLVATYVSRGAPVGGESSVSRVLSEREVEVLALIGRGLTNPEIAEELVISMATVKSHVRHILAKLHLRDRVQAVLVAHEQGLV